MIDECEWGSDRGKSLKRYRLDVFYRSKAALYWFWGILSCF